MEKVERNALFEAIVAGGLNPIECHLEERHSGGFRNDNSALITHQPSHSYFKITRGNKGKLPETGEQVTIYHVKRAVIDGPETKYDALWGAVVIMIRQWAEEISTPDLWANLRNIRRSFADSPENTRFTVNEQRQISTQLGEIKAYVKKSYQLSDEEFTRIEERLDEAEEASHRIGRKDWVLLFSGLVLTLIVTDTVTPEVAQHIFTMVGHGLANLFDGGAKFISGPP